MHAADMSEQNTWSAHDKKEHNGSWGLDSITDCLDCFYWLKKFLFLMRPIPLSLPQALMQGRGRSFLFYTLELLAR